MKINKERKVIQDFALSALKTIFNRLLKKANYSEANKFVDLIEESTTTTLLKQHNPWQQSKCVSL